MLSAELGDDFERLFAEFEWEPLAAASIGQTHRARLHTGESVVVKVQRLGIEATMERDLAALGLLANLAQRRTSFGSVVRSGELLAQFAEGLRAELDFRREADAMTEMASRLDGAHVRVARLHRSLCTCRILVQERFDGQTVSNLGPPARPPAPSRTPSSAGRSRRAGEPPAAVDPRPGAALGYFHADPHPGNVFVLADGSLGLIDFGAVGRLDPIQQGAIADMFLALTQRDVSLLRDAVERIAELGDTATPDALEHTLARMMADHVRPGAPSTPT